MVYGDEPAPCEGCRVEIMAENEDAAQIYLTARRQIITAGMGKVIDINIQAVKTVMDLYQVKDQRSCLDKVRYLFFHFLKDSE